MELEIKFVRLPANIAEFRVEIDILDIEAEREAHPGLPAALAEGRFDFAVGAVVFLQFEDAVVALQGMRDQLQVDAGVLATGEEFQRADPVERLGMVLAVGRVIGTSSV